MESVQNLANLAGEGITFKGAIWNPRRLEIMSPNALRFVAELSRRFEGIRQDLLQNRGKPEGWVPHFVNGPEDDWKIAPLPKDLETRTVEITGPVDRKMIINALNSGADCFMADFEDSSSPTWDQMIDGQVNLFDAVSGEMVYTDLEKGKTYILASEPATLHVRPRGWHLYEKHVLIDGEPISASLFDFGMFIFHNGQKLLNHGTGPYFYLPKMESHMEARLWNDVFTFTEQSLQMPHGSIKATVLIEHIFAAFEMDAILYELRDHSAGLNCGRWDYIFSIIKNFGQEQLFPNRSLITMTTPMMEAYVKLLVQTCHRRNAPAMGGMAAQIPVRNDPELNARNMDMVRQGKLNEAHMGMDGTWVAHPGLIEIAREAFAESGPSQVYDITPEDLVNFNFDDMTVDESGLDDNVQALVKYLSAWLLGLGCVAVNNKMEDLATFQVSRWSLLSWIHTHGKFSLDHVMEKVRMEASGLSNETLTVQLIQEMLETDELVEYVSTHAYQHLK